jgi:hypothetical protein
MNRDALDFHAVRDSHIQIHDALLNWARVVRVHLTSGGNCAPMFRHYRTANYSFDLNDQEWVDDTPKRPPPDMLAGWKMEKQMRFLPEKHRAAVKWHYVEPHKPPARVAYRLALTQSALFDLVHDARSMLKNRC